MSGMEGTLHRALASEVSGRKEEALNLYREAARGAGNDLELLFRSSWMAALLEEELESASTGIKTLREILERGMGDDQYRAKTATMALQMAGRTKSQVGAALQLDSGVAEAFRSGSELATRIRCANLEALLAAGRAEASVLRGRSAVLVETLDPSLPEDLGWLLAFSGSSLDTSTIERLQAKAREGLEDPGLSRVDQKVLRSVLKSGRLAADLRDAAQGELAERLRAAVKQGVQARDAQEVLRQLIDFLDSTDGLDALDTELTTQHVASFGETFRKDVASLTGHGEQLVFSVSPRLISRGFEDTADQILGATLQHTARRDGRDSRAHLELQLRRLQAVADRSVDRDKVLGQFADLRLRASQILGENDHLIGHIDRHAANYTWRTRPQWRRLAGRVKQRLGTTLKSLGPGRPKRSAD